MMAASIPLLLFLGLSSVHGASPTPLGPDAPGDPSTLSVDEINFIAQNCPEIARTASSGAVVAYGKILTPPILVTVLRDRVYVNEIPVRPTQKRSEDFEVRKAADRLEMQFFNDKRRGVSDPLGNVDKRAKLMKASRKLDDYSLSPTKTKAPKLIVHFGNKKEERILDGSPSTVAGKAGFIADVLLREYEIRKDSSSKAEALRWLHTILDDLKQRGIIESVHWSGDEEVVGIRFKDEPFGGTYGFGDSNDGLTPERVKELKQNWMAKLPEMQSDADMVVGRLKDGSLLVYSYGFERAIHADEGVVAALRAIEQGKQVSNDTQLVQKDLSLSTQELHGLEEELR